MVDIDVRVLRWPRVAIDDGVVATLTGRQLLLATPPRVGPPGPRPVAPLLADVWPEETASAGAVRVALTRLRATLDCTVVHLKTPTFARHPPRYAQVDIS